MIGAGHAPDELSCERHGHWRGVVDDLAGQGACGRKQILGFVQGPHEALLMRLLRGEHAAGVAPLQRGLDAHQARQEP